ncbi:hypothetical protein GDO78_000064 [Eleutherodactylus coqui]|uniref:Uncharacterized protein n=1 Tax=Eleutherodactylus coqui TaxID=57060 RepID=A0A8J6FNA0_ELECQ|nr:hypothetical protein GDO78_000064 [Eleutherodactylus coqui]
MFCCPGPAAASIHTGPSWCTPETAQKFLIKEKSSQELQNVSKPEGLQRMFYIGSLHDQWSMLPDLHSTFPVDPSSVRSMNFPTDRKALQPGHPVDPRKPKLHSSGCSIEQPSPHNLQDLTGNHGAHGLKVLKGTQKLFQKSMMHSLNTLHLDVSYFNKCIEESNSVFDDLLRVKGDRNRTLHQMNIQLGKLSESLERLANQQQAELILSHDYPRRRGGRIGGSPHDGEVRRSLKVTSSAVTCSSEQGVMLGTPPLQCNWSNEVP